MEQKKKNHHFPSDRKITSIATTNILQMNAERKECFIEKWSKESQRWNRLTIFMCIFFLVLKFYCPISGDEEIDNDLRE